MSNNLAICDDCGKEVSIHANTCPNCGCVFEDSISVLHKVASLKTDGSVLVRENILDNLTMEQATLPITDRLKTELRHRLLLLFMRR